MDINDVVKETNEERLAIYDREFKQGAQVVLFRIEKASIALRQAKQQLKDLKYEPPALLTAE